MKDSRHEGYETRFAVPKPDKSPIIVLAMRSVNALETQKREDVADTADRIGFRLYNHCGRFPPSVVVPDCSFTLQYVKRAGQLSH
jgi:hypothetical protein